MQGTRAIHIQQHLEQPPLVKIHSVMGAFLEEMTADRLAVLQTTHMQDDKEVQQDFTTAIAALLSRYKVLLLLSRQSVGNGSAINRC